MCYENIKTLEFNAAAAPRSYTGYPLISYFTIVKEAAGTMVAMAFIILIATHAYSSRG